MRWHLDEMQRLPLVKTVEVSNIRNTKAEVAGNVEWDGDAILIERGICFSQGSIPTISDEHIASGNTEGDFSAQISGLTRNTAYRARAYAINEIGVAYGSLVFFTTADVLDTIPSLTTLQATEITPSSARVGGEITSDGGNEIHERGICFSLEAAPDTSDTFVATGGGDAPYSEVLTGLEDGVTYFARAYAINEMGIGYGNEISFQTPLQGLPAVITLDANVNSATSASITGNVTSEGDAPVVTRGICYSTEPQPDANDVVIVSGSGAGFFNCTLTGLQEGTTYYARAYASNSIGTIYGNEISFATPFGTVSSIICDATFVIGSYVQGLQVSNGSLNIVYTGGNGGSYASQTINSTGVTGLVASLVSGNFSIGSGNLLLNITGTPQGNGAALFNFLIGGQTCTFNIQVDAGSVADIDCENVQITGNFTDGFPVSNGSIIINYANGNGGYSSQTIVSTGVTGLTATLASGIFSTGGGSLTLSITGTAYQTGIAYLNLNIGGQNCIVEIPILDQSQHTCGAENVHNPDLTYGSMVDQEGNTYKTIVIGTQEWMAENLKTSIYVNGDPIAQPFFSQWENVTNGAVVIGTCPYGAYYNAYTLGDPRKLCPVGWHVPSVSEWNTTVNYLGGVGLASSKMKSAGTTYWASNFGASNTSGFSGLPAGQLSGFGLGGVGTSGSWWTTSSSNPSTQCTICTQVFVLEPTAYGGAVYYVGQDSNIGNNVRCVRD
jgi:uncharacterized protein (TIGR02145 family)